MKSILFQLVLLMAFAIACHRHLEEREVPAADIATPSPEQQRADLQKGEKLIAETYSVESMLRQNAIFLVDVPTPEGKVLKVDYMAREINWHRFNKDERQLIKQRLARYLSLSNQVGEIEAKPGIYMINQQEIVRRRDAATKFQKSVELFEKIFGENYNPKKSSSGQPLFHDSREA